MASLCQDAFERGDETEKDDLDLDWCVDVNATLSAMTTTELLSAIAEGKVSRDTRAWRPGLEAWSRLCEIHELARAFDPQDADPMSETGVTPPAIEIISLTPHATDVGQVHPSVWGRASRNRGGGPWAGSPGTRVRGALIDARWIVAGAAIAATFIGLSLAGTSRPEPRFMAQAGSGASDACAAVVAAAAALEAKPAHRSGIERVASSPWAEPGQRRLRNGRGQGRGR